MNVFSQLTYESLGSFNPFVYNVVKCEHRKIFKVRLAILQHYA